MYVPPAPRTLHALLPRVIVALIVVASLGRLVAAPQPAAGRTVHAFTGARLIVDPRKPAIADGVLLVRDGKVIAAGPRAQVQVPADAARHDLAGKTVIPGLINTHGHVGETVGLRQAPELYTRQNVLDTLGVYARYGVTTVFSLGGDQQAGVTIRDEQDASLAQGTAPLRARLFVAGPVITGDTPAAAREVVGRVAAMRADWAKIRVDDNLGSARKMAPAIYQAVIDEAHTRTLRVATHMFYLDDAKALLAAGSDLLAHSVRDKPVDDELIAAMRKRSVCLVPTLTREVSTFVYEKTPDFFADPFFTREADPAVIAQLNEPARQQAMRTSTSAQRYKVALEMASRNLKALQDAGIGIAFGTDSGLPGRFAGFFEHMELDLMVKAGLTPAQALTSATSGAADCMQVQGKLGTLTNGAWADFLVLAQNPLDDIRHMRTIESVWIAGHEVPRR